MPNQIGARKPGTSVWREAVFTSGVIPSSMSRRTTHTCAFSSFMMGSSPLTCAPGSTRLPTAPKMEEGDCWIITVQTQRRIAHNPNHGFWIRSTRYETGNLLVRISAFKPDFGNSAAKTTNYTIAFIRPPTPDWVSPSTITPTGSYLLLPLPRG